MRCARPPGRHSQPCVFAYPALMANSADSDAPFPDAGADGPGPSVPSVDQLLHPTLSALADRQTHDLPEIVGTVADALELDPQSRTARIPSGRTVLENRVAWARTCLVKAGLAEVPRESAIAITDAGQAALIDQSGPVTIAYLRRSSPGYANWMADMGGALPEDELTGKDSPTVWMVRAGRGGRYAPVFVERSAVVVGWGQTGDIDGLQRDAILERVKAAYTGMSSNQRSQGANTLYRVANTMNPGDLVLTPEPSTKTVLFGRVAGSYAFLDEPIGEDLQHSRHVAWFARIPRGELSYGARGSLSSMLTLTRPSHETELLRLAEENASDTPPAPLEQKPGARAVPAPLATTVKIPPGVVMPMPSTREEFQTVPRKLLSLLDNLDSGQLALPDFQRSFVWAPEATRELLVSMIRSFPAGALLLLQGGSSTFKARAVEEAPPLQVAPANLVLDGQQRLTSLYQAIYGVGQSRFFLDIGALISGAEVNDVVRVFSTERAAPFEHLEAQARALMMPLSAVRGSGAGDWRDRVVDLRDDEDPSEVRGLLRRVEATFIEPLVQYSFPVTILPGNTELEAVCTIFETLNRTGKPLTPFELISARAFAGGLSLYDYWASARDNFPILADFDVEPYYLLQVIALRLGLSAKRSSVLRMSADDIAGQWDDAVSDMASAVSLLRTQCGVPVSKWLPYRPMLIPLAAAWREVASATGPASGAMRAKLKRWFWSACFTGEYESSSATLAERDAPILKTWLLGGDEPPVVTQFTWNPERWRTITVKQQGLYRSTIALTLTEQPRDFHTGVPLTHETIEASKVDDHHVFPRGYLADVDRGREIDSVLNHCLIDRATNIRIGKRAPSEYLAEIRAALGGELLDGVLGSQMLPRGSESPLLSDDFDGFLAWRRDRLNEALTEHAGERPPNAREVDPLLAKLDLRVEAVELGLRALIAARLDNESAAVPHHVALRVDDRMAATAAKHPGLDGNQAEELDAKLQYFDLRDLQNVVCAKTLWPLFEDVFGTKEQLSMRFDQVAELRNMFRHSRATNAVTVKDGEAGLLWFERTLDDPEMTTALDGSADADGLASRPAAVPMGPGSM
jgi:hypothetical protein